MWTIIPDHQRNYDKLNPKRLSHTYLHGKLEDDCGYDCYGLTNCELKTKENHPSSIDHTKLNDGEYPCIYKKKKCTLFYWTGTFHQEYHGHGLVCYNDDLESIEYAKKCMNDKVNHI
jgi:hypothetical protein